MPERSRRGEDRLVEHLPADVPHRHHARAGRRPGAEVRGLVRPFERRRDVRDEERLEAGLVEQRCKCAFLGIVFIIPALLLPVPWWEVAAGALLMSFVSSCAFVYLLIGTHFAEQTLFPETDEQGVIEHYRACLNREVLGFELEAFVQVSMRMWCCARIYGPVFAAAVPLRMLWGNLINGAAMPAEGSIPGRAAMCTMAPEPILCMYGATAWLSHSAEPRLTSIIRRNTSGVVVNASPV